MSKVNYIYSKFLYYRKGLIFLSVFLFFSTIINAQDKYSVYVIDTDSVQISNFQIHLYNSFDDIIIDSSEGRIMLSKDDIINSDSLSIFDIDTEDYYPLKSKEIKFTNNIIFFKSMNRLNDVVVTSGIKPIFEIGVTEKARKKSIASNEYSFLTEVVIDSIFDMKKIISLNFYLTNAKSFISKEKIKSTEILLKPIVFQCKDVNCSESEKYNFLGEIQYKAFLNKKRVLKLNLSELNLNLVEGNLYFGFQIISSSAAFKSVNQKKIFNSNCYIKNIQAPSYSKYFHCPKVTLTIK